MWPPTNNHYYTVARGRKILSAEGRAYQQSCAVALCRFRPREPLAGSLGIEVFASPPDRRRRDLDNLWKPLLDALVKSRIIADDGMIDDERMVRCSPTPGGSLAISVWAID